MEKSTSSGQGFSTAQFLLKYFQGLYKPLGRRVHNSNSDRQLTVTMLTGVTITNCTEQLQRTEWEESRVMTDVHPEDKLKNRLFLKVTH